MDTLRFGNSSTLISKSAIDDPFNPYYLHHSDSTCLVLVSQLLTGDNYASESRAMLIALSVKNKLGFIDGSISKPGGNDLNLLNSWIRNNNMAISWILNSVSKEISASIIFSESGYEIWLDLEDRFQQSNGPRIFQLRRELVTITRIKTLGVKELNSYYQIEYIMSFLMGLNDSFAQVRGQLLLMDSLPPINKVFSLSSQEERQRTIGQQNPGTSSTNGMVFVVKNDGFKGSVANADTRNTRSNRGQKNDRPFYTHCNDHGHTIEKCYKLHGYPLGFKQ
ncbi:uncharacterized protein LOC112094408 [Morus notabilis]|uniref:uncharacterized protein LOC112094408 n=1 Tax=Morus notabilis TaxID=981085 RepID=UPI000CED5675|nr:uncharacterized protein LOC112094408 [Morus notabilis]